MSTSLTQSIQDDMKSAMRSKETHRLGVIRLILAAIKQREVDERITLDDTQVLSVLEKMVKQRRDSINQFQQANRQDLIDKENYEISILEHYLPPPLDGDELEKIIDHAISATGANSQKDMGKVITQLKPLVQGRAEMGIVSSMIKAKLASL